MKSAYLSGARHAARLSVLRFHSRVNSALPRSTLEASPFVSGFLNDFADNNVSIVLLAENLLDQFRHGCLALSYLLKTRHFWFRSGVTTSGHPSFFQLDHIFSRTSAFCK